MLSTATVPSTASLFVQTRSEPGSAGKVTLAKEPVTGELNSVNVLPAENAAPLKLVTIRLAPGLTVTLDALILSLFGIAAGSSFITTVPLIVTGPAVRVPRAGVNAPRAGVPGIKVPPASTFTLPTEPEPLKVPLELTVTGEGPFAPLTTSVPAPTVVFPE